MIDLLDRRRINSVVLGMSADEANESDAVPIVEAHDQATPVPADVEYYAVSAYDARPRPGGLPEGHMGGRSPFNPAATVPTFLRMTDAVTIRRGVPESLRAQATTLYCEALKAKLTPFLGPVKRAARFLAPAMRADRAFVAIDDTGILCIAGFQENRTGLFDIGLLPLWREYGLSAPVRAIGLMALHRREVHDTLLMDGIAVAAAARGRGIGTRLLAAVCDHARDLGKTGVRLDVVDTNPRAGALYERQGFIAVERTGIGPFRAIFPFRTVTTMCKTV